MYIHALTCSPSLHTSGPTWVLLCFRPPIRTCTLHIGTSPHRYEEALRAKVESLGEAHFSVGHTLYNLACLMLDSKQIPEALEYMRRTLAIYEVAFGEKHQLTEDVRVQVDQLELELEEDAAALNAFAEKLAAGGASGASESQDGAFVAGGGEEAEGGGPMNLQSLAAELQERGGYHSDSSESRRRRELGSTHRQTGNRKSEVDFDSEALESAFLDGQLSD